MAAPSAMMTRYYSSPPSERSGLLRKIVLIFLLVTALALGLVILFREKPGYPYWLQNGLAAASLAVAAAFTARLALRRRSGLLRLVASLAALMVGLYVLGMASHWKYGIGPLNFWPRVLDWDAIAQAGLGIYLVFLALLMGTLVWWLVRQSVNVQPWVAHAGAEDVHGGALARPAAKTALWVFLGVATSLFALFISAYAMRISFLDWSPLPQPRLLMLNTAVLVLASGAMQWAVIAARRRNARTVRSALLLGGVLGFAFVAGQLAVWKQLSDAGYFLATSAATGFFYLLTAVHAIHVLGGLVGWGRTWARASHRAAAMPASLTLSVEMCAIYWHFLLVVWVVLFAVLASGYLGLSICTPAVPL